MPRLRGIQAAGISVREGPAEPGGYTETPTTTCRHCPKILLVPHGSGYEDIGGFCEHCQSVVCRDCAILSSKATSPREACRPWADKVEAIMRKHDLRRSMGL